MTVGIKKKGLDHIDFVKQHISFIIIFFFNCESNHGFVATLSFDCVSIPSPSKVLTIICGKILCEHCQSRLREYDDHDFVWRNCDSA